jgi:phage N-6-adenine-methyltransferase
MRAACRSFRCAALTIFVTPILLRNLGGRPCIGRVAMSGAERQARYRKLAKKRTRAARDDWFTPPNIIALAVAVMGSIDVDAASCAAANETVGAKVFYDLHDDGLKRPWHGRVWLNAPYSEIGRFVEKMLAEVASGRVTEAILLTQNSTDTMWFQKAAAWASAICFPAQRIRFVSPHGRASGSPPQGSAIFYFGQHADRFAEVFAPIGRIVVPSMK